MSSGYGKCGAIDYRRELNAHYAWSVERTYFRSIYKASRATRADFLADEVESLSWPNCSTVQLKDNGPLRPRSNKDNEFDDSDNDLYKGGKKPLGEQAH